MQARTLIYKNTLLNNGHEQFKVIEILLKHHDNNKTFFS